MIRFKLDFNVTMADRLRRPVHFDSLTALVHYARSSKRMAPADVYALDARGSVKCHIGSIKPGGKLQHSAEMRDLMLLAEMFK